ncbi:MAG: formyltetrahydrofolate deformylase [Pseudomonadota bacterium]
MTTHSAKSGESKFRLVVSCPDRVGIVSAVSQFLADRGASLVESHHHTDEQQRWFFMRNVFSVAVAEFRIDSFISEFRELAEPFGIEWKVCHNKEPKRVAILASHASHCLADILHRWHSGELHCDIPCVIANHENLRSMVEWHGIPFHYVPVDKSDKSQHFSRVDEIIKQSDADTIVLARYMQILPPEMCERYAGQLINIHHSFLPAFIGANPYQKAYDRGVKLIGATCHYVTQDLDEGPIIEQDVVRVNHDCDKDDMVRLGRDVERSALSSGLRYHLEDRVIIHGNKTVVFSN